MMEEWMWRKIIEKMYDPKDYEVLLTRFVEIIEERKNRIKTGGSTMSSNSKFLMDSSSIQ